MDNSVGAIGPAGENFAINRNRYIPVKDPYSSIEATNIGSINNPYAYVKGVDFNSQ